MGIFLCDLCNAHLPWDFDHVHTCDHGVLKARIELLEARAYSAERKSDAVQSAVKHLLASLPTFEGEAIVVQVQFLRDLWSAADCKERGAFNANDFLVHWMATHRVLCEAFELFRSKGSRKQVPVLDKLTILKEQCVSSAKILGYKDETLDVEPRDLLKQGNDA